MDDAQLRTVWNNAQQPPRLAHLSEPMTLLVKRTLAKKVRQVGQIAAIWDELVPDDLARHTALEGLNRGVLRVTVDSASHRYQLRTLLDGGLMAQLQDRFGGTLRKVTLLPGQFCSVDLAGQRRYE
jgi:predicted nucleic acid-binding Zn ribbon protein